MKHHAKWLREAAKIAIRAGLPNVASTCEQGAAEIDRLEAVIRSMPVLTGDDARRFAAAMQDDRKVSSEDYERAQRAFAEIGLPASTTTEVPK